jgi:hypothetical protein
MSTSEILINLALVALVLRQISERPVELRDLVRPLLLIGVAATSFLHSIPTAGNDLVLIGLCVTLGVTCGGLCAAATHMRLGPDGPLARAGGVAAALWIGGIGARMGFAYAAAHGAGPTIARFSVAHHITGSEAWTAALVLMAIAEAITRLLVIHLRARRLAAGTPAAVLV